MQKVKQLDGLRGIAALIVLFGHLIQTCFITYRLKLYTIIFKLNLPIILKLSAISTINLFTESWLAIWIFWVLSAYVISIKLFKGNSTQKTIIESFSKRYFRLYFPVLASVMIAFIILAFNGMYNHELANMLGTHYDGGWLDSLYNFDASFTKALSSATYNSFFEYDPNSSYNAVLWTIAAELIGSYMLFALFALIRKNKVRYIFYILLTIVLILLNYIWLLGFLLGYILCDFDYSESKHKIIISLKAIENKILQTPFLVFALSIVFIAFGKLALVLIHFPANYHFLILSCFVVYITLRNKYFIKIFSSRIALFFGKISFSLYLIQLPIIASFTSYMILANNNLQGKLTASALTIILVIVIAYFFNKYVDEKSVIISNRIGKYFSKNQ